MHSRSIILPFIILGILFLLSLYAFAGLTALQGASNPIWYSTGVSTFYVLGSVSVSSFLIIILAGNRLNKAIRNFLFAFVFIHLFTLLIFDVFLLIDDLLRLILGVFQVGDYTRSVTLIQVATTASIIPAVLFLLGMLIGPYRYRVRELNIPIKNLPDNFNELKIVQISDIHSGSFYNPSAVRKGVNLILNQKPDVIFFTGDLVNDDASEMDEYKSIFGELKAPLGVYSILGNHDYGDYVQWPSKEAKLENLNKLKAVHKEMGWRLLLDEHVYLERDEDQIGLIGVENWGKGFHQIGNLKQAFEGIKAEVKILLSHDPTHWDEEVTKSFQSIDLTLSGHTHGAQMGFEIGRFRWSPIKLRYKKWAGLYQNGGQFLYINRGFGFLGYPGRLGIWPEITSIKLVKSL